MVADMALRNWNAYALARRAHKDPKTINKFLTAEAQTEKTAHAIAKALGHSARRYLLGVEIAA
jgi:plasmid maintenance system antidote protein VapI